jgi:hypothetical protein
MLSFLAFAVVAVALATPFAVPLIWGQKTLVGALTVCAALIAASALMQAADAQEARRPLPNDPEQFRMIEECLELTFGRSGGKETYHMYQACMDYGHYHELASQVLSSPQNVGHLHRGPSPASGGLDPTGR